MPLLDLPPELINAILVNIHGDKELLCSVSLTCHVLHDQASQVLYFNVRVRNFVQLFRFAETMVKNSNLARFVTSFVGPMYPFAFFQPLVGWLQNIINLKSLHFTSGIDSREPLPKVPFRLASLKLSCYYDFAQIESFLESQTDLVYISANALRYVEPRPLSPLACPKLKVLRGNIYAARTFLPGRRVTRFEWKYQQDEPIQVSANLLSEISDELNNLRSLSYMTASTNEGIHSMYTLPNSYLRSLRFLEIQTMHSEDWISIPTLPHLRVLLVLEPTYVLMSMLDEPARVVELFSKCPTLQYVDVGGRDHRNTLSCFRWLRGVDEPISIPLRVAEQGRLQFLDE